MASALSSTPDQELLLGSQGKQTGCVVVSVLLLQNILLQFHSELQFLPFPFCWVHCGICKDSNFQQVSLKNV